MKMIFLKLLGLTTEQKESKAINRARALGWTENQINKAKDLVRQQGDKGLTVFQVEGMTNFCDLIAKETGKIPEYKQK